MVSGAANAPASSLTLQQLDDVGLFPASANEWRASGAQVGAVLDFKAVFRIHRSSHCTAQAGRMGRLMDARPRIQAVKKNPGYPNANLQLATELSDAGNRWP